MPFTRSTKILTISASMVVVLAILLVINFQRRRPSVEDEYMAQEKARLTQAEALNTRGAALGLSAEQTFGPESKRLQEEAVSCYWDALAKLDRWQQARSWALTQRNLGIALYHLGTDAFGPESRKLLTESSMASRAALEAVATHQDQSLVPSIRYNLARTLGELSNRAPNLESQQSLVTQMVSLLEAIPPSSSIDQFGYNPAEAQVLLSKAKSTLVDVDRRLAQREANSAPEVRSEGR